MSFKTTGSFPGPHESTASRLWLTLGLVLTAFTGSPPLHAQSARQANRENAIELPNILWIFAEDTSPWMGCYGDKVNEGYTPNIDALAERGVRFSRAYVPAPVCSACRSALMAGQNQIRFNAHQHRSSRGPAKLQLPPSLKLLPQLLKDAGYFTFNCGKSDYNFVWDNEATYSYENKSRSKVPWQQLVKNQPFFGQIQTAGGKNNTRKFPKSRKTDPASVTVPPDYPQNQLYQETIAQHYDAIRMDDDFIGSVLAQLQTRELDKNTIVVYFSDHGANNLVRHKQMPTEGGLHVPFIITGPDPWVPAPSVRADLVNLLDLSATTLAWAGIKQPKWYEGQNLFGFKVIPRTYVAAAKDRLDHTIDRVRSLRTERFRYTRNYKLDRILLQPQYRDDRDFVVNLRELHEKGELPEQLDQIYFGERAAEELYDLQNDPSQLRNLAEDRAFKKELELHREYLDAWLSKGDFGDQDESKEELRFQAQDQKWGQGVNPEYEQVRVDSDGDGLSDKWEEINGRDPKDGRLQFAFDCGGWQTEGWKSLVHPTDNIAGSLGFLDFHLPTGGTTLRRTGLKAPASANGNAFRLQVRVSEATRCKVELQTDSGKRGGSWVTIPASASFTEVTLPYLLQDASKIHTLSLILNGPDDALIEIDRMETVILQP